MRGPLRPEATRRAPFRELLGKCDCPPGPSAHGITQLLVLECKVETHKLSLAPKDTCMRKASYLRNRMLRARI